MKDKSGIFFKYFDLFFLQFKTICCSGISLISCNLRGIKTGKRIKFIGLTVFRRTPNSTISISNDCIFRSSFSSNLIGINRRCMISTLLPESKIIIGNQCGFSGTVIGAFKSIKLGERVRCGANTLITDSDWHLNDSRSSQAKDIVIENNVWIGEGVRILKGVTIGENTIIGAGSVVTKSIPPNVIAAGNPCKVIKIL